MIGPIKSVPVTHIYQINLDMVDFVSTYKSAKIGGRRLNFFQTPCHEYQLISYFHSFPLFLLSNHDISSFILSGLAFPEKLAAMHLSMLLLSVLLVWTITFLVLTSSVSLSSTYFVQLLFLRPDNMIAFMQYPSSSCSTGSWGQLHRKFRYLERWSWGHSIPLSIRNHHWRLVQ